MINRLAYFSVKAHIRFNSTLDGFFHPVPFVLVLRKAKRNDFLFQPVSSSSLQIKSDWSSREDGYHCFLSLTLKALFTRQGLFF